jgi:hypothetical protein
MPPIEVPLVRAGTLDSIDPLHRHVSALTTSPPAAEARFSLPVFCVSAIENQKLCGVRKTDGPAICWNQNSDTQIPALRAHVHRATLAQRARTVRRQAESVIQVRNLEVSLVVILGMRGDQFSTRALALIQGAPLWRKSLSHRLRARLVD